MKKLIDFDGLFDERLNEYMKTNQNKYTEREWATVIAHLYQKFGDTYYPKLKASPKSYYAGMDDKELVETLEAHIRENVPVSDFLCNELERRRPEGLFALIDSGNEQLRILATNLAGDDVRAFPAYFRLLEGENDGELKDAVCDQLKSAADSAKELALDFYARGIERERMLEILSRVKSRDERVFDILMRVFRESDEEIPMHSSYLAAYGDERALPALLEVIDREDINYLEYQELKYAIEALGGEYTRPRDFTEDAYFQEIQRQSALPPKEEK